MKLTRNRVCFTKPCINLPVPPSSRWNPCSEDVSSTKPLAKSNRLILQVQLPTTALSLTRLWLSIQSNTHSEQLWLPPPTRAQTSEQKYSDLTTSDRRQSTSYSRRTPRFSRGTRSYASSRSKEHSRNLGSVPNSGGSYVSTVEQQRPCFHGNFLFRSVDYFTLIFKFALTRRVDTVPCLPKTLCTFKLNIKHLFGFVWEALQMTKV